MENVAQMDDDPLQWEINQLDKLKELAEAYGWEIGGIQFKKRMKLIQMQSVARQKANAQVGAATKNTPPAGRAALKRAKPAGWVTQLPEKGKCLAPEPGVNRLIC